MDEETIMRLAMERGTQTPVDPRAWSPDARRALATLEALPETHTSVHLRAVYEYARRSDDPVAVIVTGLAEVCRERERLAKELTRFAAHGLPPVIMVVTEAERDALAAKG